MAIPSLINPWDPQLILSAISNHRSKSLSSSYIFGTTYSRKTLNLLCRDHFRIEAFKGKVRRSNHKKKSRTDSNSQSTKIVTQERSASFEIGVNADEINDDYHRDLLVQTYVEGERLRQLVNKLGEGSNPLEILREDGDWHPDQFWVVMRYLKEQSRMKEALQVFDFWKDLWTYRQNGKNYTRLIQFLREASMLEEAKQILEEMRIVGVKPTVTTFNNVIHAYAERGQFEEANTFLEQMVEYGLVPNPITYTGLIQAYGKEGRYDGMVKIFKKMQFEGCIPEKNIYNALIREFARGGLRVRMEAAYGTLISKRWRPDSSTLNAMVEAYAAVGCMDKMEKFYGHIRNFKYTLQERSLRKMALAYIESNKFYHLEKMVKEVGFQRSDMKGLVWNLRLLSHACVQSIKGMDSVIRDMRSAKFTPNVTTINILALTYLKMKNFTSLNHVAYQIHSLHICPDLVTIGAFIDGCMSGWDGLPVLEDWNRMQMFQCPVEVKTDPVVLAALGKGNFHTSCEQAFLSLDLAAETSKDWTYTDLIRLYFRNEGLNQSEIQ
eukprot:Gb_17788 [translate_table: standard]